MEIVLANNGVPILRTTSATRYSEIESTIRRRFKYNLTSAVLISATGQVLRLETESEDTTKAFLIIRSQAEIQEHTLPNEAPIDSAEEIDKQFAEVDSETLQELRELAVMI